MNIEELREYCLNKPGVTEHLPFDEVTLVFKVQGKMFALLPTDHELSITLKCIPEYAEELRERFDSIVPAFHMNKTHWNTIYMEQGAPEKLVKELIDLSYHLVYDNLPRKLRVLKGEYAQLLKKCP